MKYIATINGKKYEIELERVEEYRPLSRGEKQRSQEINEKSVKNEETIGNKKVAQGDKAVENDKGGNGQNGTGNKTLVESPLPGKVTAVLIKEGQTVNAGESLLMIEAMKMETEIVAPVSGTVANISVKPNQQVDAGEGLLEIR